jgi:AcrR family transcriptional regulator
MWDTLIAVGARELPPPLDQLWGAPDGLARPRKRSLSVDRIVDAAIALADADGLEAVSMSRVAERLGFTTMSLYRHVRSKEELLVLMTDAALGEPPASLDAAAEGWRKGLERWTFEALAALQRHPWFVRVPINAPPLTPSQLGWFDRGLRALAGTALTEQEKAAVILVLNGHVFARVLVDLQEADAPAAASEVLTTIIDEERFPALWRAIESGIFTDDSTEADFAFGVERILDGVETLLSRR